MNYGRSHQHAFSARAVKALAKHLYAAGVKLFPSARGSLPPGLECHLDVEAEAIFRYILPE